MNESNFGRQPREEQIESLMRDYEAEHGVQTDEEKARLKEIWKQGFIDKEIEDTAAEETTKDAEK